MEHTIKALQQHEIQSGGQPVLQRESASVRNRTQEHYHHEPLAMPGSLLVDTMAFSNAC